MKKAFVFLTAASMFVSVAGLALAQSQPTPPTTASPPTEATPPQSDAPPAAKARGKGAGVRHMAGAVVSVNADTKSLTVKRTGKKKSKEMTFTLTGDAAGRLTDYKPGDNVRVSYVDESGKLVAQSVTTSKHAAKAGKK
jgi:hypothetical protein